MHGWRPPKTQTECCIVGYSSSEMSGTDSKNSSDQRQLIRFWKSARYDMSWERFLTLDKLDKAEPLIVALQEPKILYVVLLLRSKVRIMMETKQHSRKRKPSQFSDP